MLGPCNNRAYSYLNSGNALTININFGDVPRLVFTELESLIQLVHKQSFVSLKCLLLCYLSYTIHSVWAPGPNAP